MIGFVDTAFTSRKRMLLIYVITLPLLPYAYSLSLALLSEDHLVCFRTSPMWVIVDKWEGSGDGERIRTETDGRSQGRDRANMLHLPRGISQWANKGV